MLRTFASLLLTFAAIAWAVFSISLCFFLASGFWRDLLGSQNAFYGALTACAVCFVGAKLLLRWADRLLEPLSGPFDSAVYQAAPRDTFYKDWRRYAADIMRNRRYALYARTRQWEKLAALAAEGGGAAGASSMLTSDRTDVAEPPPPRRTSMGSYVSFDENRRGARRLSEEAAARARRDRWRWRALDD
jgi:hypothetical protein